MNINFSTQLNRISFQNANIISFISNQKTITLIAFIALGLLSACLLLYRTLQVTPFINQRVNQLPKKEELSFGQIIKKDQVVDKDSKKTGMSFNSQELPSPLSNDRAVIVDDQQPSCKEEQRHKEKELKEIEIPQMDNQESLQITIDSGKSIFEVYQKD